MHFAGPRVAHHVDEPSRGRSPNDRVVNHHHALSAQHLAHRVVFHLHLRVTSGLRGLKKGSADVVIPDQGELEGKARFLRETECSRIRRIGHAEHEIGVRSGEVARQPATQLASGAIYRASKYLAVGAREIHVLEHALSGILLFQREARPNAVRVDGDYFTPLHFTLDRRAEQIERAALGSEDCRITELSHHQRSPAARVARSEKSIPDCHDEAVGAFDSAESVSELFLGLYRSRLGQPVDENFRVHRRREDRAAVLELVPQLRRVDQVSVWRDSNVAVPEPSEDRLRILDRRCARRAVPRVTDGNVSGQAAYVGPLAAFRHEAHALDGSGSRSGVDRDDSLRFLTAMLQRVETEMRNLRRVLMAEYSEDSAHVSERLRRWRRLPLSAELAGT